MTESPKKPARKSAKVTPMQEVSEGVKAMKPGANEVVKGLLDEIESLAHKVDHWQAKDRLQWMRREVVTRLHKIRDAL